MNKYISMRKKADSEVAVVSVLLLDPSKIEEAAAVRLRAEDFATPEFGLLYNRLCSLRLLGKNWAEAETVAAIQDCRIEPPVIEAMFESSRVYLADFRYHLKTVIADSKKRQLAGALDTARESILSPACSMAELLAGLEAAIQQVRSEASIALYNAEQVGERSLAEKTREHVVEAWTGIPELDEAIGGFHGGDLSVLAARASIGKTAFALQVAEHNANRGRGILFVSLEMTEVQVFDRLVCHDTSISFSRIRGGKRVLGDDFGRVADSIRSFADMPMHIFAPSAATVSDIHTAAKICQARGNLSLVIVDYLSLIRPSNPRTERREQVGEICKSLKRIAKELDVPILALSQLNRQAEGETPTLGMLRESGSVEEDADHVVFVHRESRTVNEGQLIVAKNRHGQCGIVECVWNGARMRYTSAPTNWQP